MKKTFNTNPELAKFSTKDLLDELLRRDHEGDFIVNLIDESRTSYTFKFWKYWLN